MSKLYLIIARDKPGAAAVRTEKLGAHLAHVEAVIDRFAVAGPLRDEAGGFIGSMLVVKAGSAAEARALLESDPYFAAGIWEDVEVHAFGAVAGDWVGGKTW
ncbi:MAG: YciI family protein [Polymorphobacter sp.]|uniref:YciI family protein n=1 Tax=Polymorphobacter sp. TaxID=1909290 RepID=UPI003A86791E